MARTKSPDPASPITFTLPRSIKRMVKNEARARKITVSAFMLDMVRGHYQRLSQSMERLEKERSDAGK